MEVSSNIIENRIESLTYFRFPCVETYRRVRAKYNFSKYCQIYLNISLRGQQRRTHKITSLKYYCCNFTPISNPEELIKYYGEGG